MMKNKTNLRGLFRDPRFRRGSFSTVTALLLLAILLALNAIFVRLERQHGWRIDLSFNAVATHSAQTQAILDQLEHPVHIYALFTRGQEDAALEALLDRYAAASSKVTWEQTDISLNPALLTRFRSASGDVTVSNDSIIVSCEETGLFRILSPADFISLSFNYDEGVYEIAGLRYESELTSAIAYVTQDKVPRVMLLQGHGELDADTLSAFTSMLIADHFDVELIQGAGSISALSPDDLLMILSPVRDISTEELNAIAGFTGRGGRLFLTCDYSDPVSSMPNWQTLLRSYAFTPMNGLVVASAEEPGTYYNNIRIDLIPQMLGSDMTVQLLSSGTDILLLTGSRAFETPSDTDRNLIVSPILQSGSKAYLKDMNSGSMSLDQSPEDMTGPFALALQAQRTTSDGYVSKAVILGCSTLLTSSQIHSMTDAQAFILTTVHYLSGGTLPDLGITPREAVRPQLSVASVTMGSLILFLLPLTVLIAALFILLPRRHL